MRVQELNPKQLKELKIMYMVGLAYEGSFAEVIDVDYDAPSYEDIAEVDSLIPDDVVIEHYAETEFTEDDFFMN